MTLCVMSIRDIFRNIFHHQCWYIMHVLFPVNNNDNVKIKCRMLVIKQRMFKTSKQSYEGGFATEKLSYNLIVSSRLRHSSLVLILGRNSSCHKASRVIKNWLLRDDCAKISTSCSKLISPWTPQFLTCLPTA